MTKVNFIVKGDVCYSITAKEDINKNSVMKLKGHFSIKKSVVILSKYYNKKVKITSFFYKLLIYMTFFSSTLVMLLGGKLQTLIKSGDRLQKER